MRMYCGGCVDGEMVAVSERSSASVAVMDLVSVNVGVSEYMEAIGLKLAFSASLPTAVAGILRVRWYLAIGVVNLSSSV